MSTQHYRYYNSPAGVGVVPVSAEAGEHARIEWQGKRKNPTPWVHLAYLTDRLDRAGYLPYATFTEAPEA